MVVADEVRVVAVLYPASRSMRPEIRRCASMRGCRSTRSSSQQLQERRCNLQQTASTHGIDVDAVAARAMDRTASMLLRQNRIAVEVDAGCSAVVAVVAYESMPMQSRRTAALSQPASTPMRLLRNAERAWYIARGLAPRRAPNLRCMELLRELREILGRGTNTPQVK
jgi:hypothetical protein